MPTRPPTYKAFTYDPVPDRERGVQRLRGRPHARRVARLYQHNPLCVRCEEEGVVREVHQWDHIVPLWKGGADHESNMQGLCKAHHDAKSKAEAQERAASRRGGGVRA